MNLKFLLAPALLLAIAGCSSDEDLTVTGQVDTDSPSGQVANISYNVGESGVVTFCTGNSASDRKAKWQYFGLVANDIIFKDRERMECGAAVRYALKKTTNPGEGGEFSNPPTHYLAMTESTIWEGIGDDFKWGGMKFTRSWTDEDFDATFAYAAKVVEYALANMDENGVYTCEINGETYTYKLLDTDLENGRPVGSQSGDYGREFAEENKKIGNKVTYIVTRDIVIDASHVSGNVYAPNVNITMRNGASIIGQVFCDKFVVDSKCPCEIKLPKKDVRGLSPCPNPGEGGGDPNPNPNPGQPEPEPEEPFEIKIPIDLRSEYVVQPDDFAIHNGDMLYVDIANGDTDPAYQTATPDKYIVVTLGENPVINIDNVAAMYKEYANKVEKCNDPKSPYYGQEVPYISADGIFTIEAYIWPGKKVNDKDGNVRIEALTYEEFGFTSLEQAVEGSYVIGTAQNGEMLSIPGDEYNVTVSAFKAIQGAGHTPYVHVSIHIKPIDE